MLSQAQCLIPYLICRPYLNVVSKLESNHTIYYTPEPINHSTINWRGQLYVVCQRGEETIRFVLRLNNARATHTTGSLNIWRPSINLLLYCVSTSGSQDFTARIDLWETMGRWIDPHGDGFRLWEWSKCLARGDCPAKGSRRRGRVMAVIIGSCNAMKKQIQP